MRNPFLYIGFLTLLSCNSNTKSVIDCSVALKFINNYSEFCTPKSPTNDDTLWIENNPLLTKNFKQEYNHILTEALKIDPEIGLGFDPIFDAQDFPDLGFELIKCDSKTGYVTVRGVDWKEFSVTLKVVVEDGKSLVEGAGIVNIPERKRAKR